MCAFSTDIREKCLFKLNAAGEARSGIAVDSTPPKVLWKLAIPRERSLRLNPWYGVTTKFYSNFVTMLVGWLEGFCSTFY